mmetsp:Transcript_56893/g.104534  ORF Transcript_56893/g.104534 Transcript_56893/m.104534 type:complete len:189 (-) Transcript_56893:70-636(-)
MQRSFAVLCTTLALGLVDATVFRGHRARLSADPSSGECGKGFDEIPGGTQAYFTDAAKKLWTHPSHLTDIDTFKTEFQCWFAYMQTTKCGGLPSKADTRKDKLTEVCLAPDADWKPVWKLFDDVEWKWYKDSFPAKEVDDVEGAYFLQALESAKEVNTKETLCLTLFAIDDGCAEGIIHNHIMLGKTD